MRYLKTLGWLALSLVTIAPIIIITYEPRGVAQTLQAAELIGAFVGVFGLSAILTTVVFLIRRKNQSLQYPGLGTGVVIVLLSGMAVLGANSRVMSLATDATLPRPMIGAPLPGTVAGSEKSVGVQPSNFTTIIDRLNGFSIRYPRTWSQVPPNEVASKLVVVSPAGVRCWVIVIPNPGSTKANGKTIVRWLTENKPRMQEELTKTLGNVYVAEIRPVVMSGSYDAALVIYTFEHQTLDLKLAVGVLETQIFSDGFTYKVGCSSAGDELTRDPDDGPAMFTNSFLVIPRAAQ